MSLWKVSTVDFETNLASCIDVHVAPFIVDYIGVSGVAIRIRVSPSRKRLRKSCPDRYLAS